MNIEDIEKRAAKEKLFSYILKIQEQMQDLEDQIKIFELARFDDEVFEKLWKILKSQK